MNIVGLGVEDLIEKPVEGRRGPATVSASKFAIRHWGKALGRRKGAMTWSQENCPIDGHRLTREGWGWRFRKVLRLAAFFSAAFSCAYPALFRSRKRAFLIASVTARTRHKVFPMVFQLHREALLIHFIHFIGLLAARPGGFPRVPSSFCRKVFSMVSALWRNIAHTFTFAAFAAGLRCGYRRPPFFNDAFGRTAPESVGI